MARLIPLLLGILLAAVRSRSDLVLENLALRQQVAVLARSGRRPRITAIDRWFWTVLRRYWSRWTDVLVIVKPETVVRWHRAGTCFTKVADGLSALERAAHESRRAGAQAIW